MVIVVIIAVGSFPVAIGDAIERPLPNRIVERYEVLEIGFPKGMDTIPDSYDIKLRNASARPAASPMPVVNHHTTYNIHGVAAAVGPRATATGNTIVGHATQRNGLDRVDSPACAYDYLSSSQLILVTYAMTSPPPPATSSSAT